MKTKHRISIPEPCSENWDAMPISGKGRSCDSCEKVVYDYSKMSDNEILYLLKTESTSCGNFRLDQLDRKLMRDKSVFPTFNLQVIALGLGVLIAAPGYAAQSTSGLEHLDLIEVVQRDQVLPQLDVTSVDDSLVTFKLVHGYSQEPIANARVEFIDVRGNIFETVRTNEQGIIVYEKKMLRERQIVEVRCIPKSKKLEREVLEWTNSGQETETIEFFPKTKRRSTRYMRRHRQLRGAWA
jgi:hypothetical protein